MRVVLVVVGKLRDAGLRELADDYLARTRRHFRCDEVEVDEAARLEGAIPEGATVVAFDAAGDSMTSEEFSKRVESWGSRGKGTIAMLIGGADGLPQPLVVGAHARVSLSRMTLPHRLARIFVLEQVYRATAILRGEPYAR